MRRLIILFFLGIYAMPLMAKPPTTNELPEPLRPWVDWVLHDHKDAGCPFLYNQGGLHRCVWPGGLDLKLNTSGGRFSQSYELYRDAWVQLPGSRLRWPDQVMLDGKPATLITQKGRPAIWMPAGEHQVTGHFNWNELPPYLQLTVTTGLIDLQVNDERVLFPTINQQNQLWLRTKMDQAGKKQQNNRLGIKVHRRLVDESPFQVNTRIALDVSGEQREILLDNPLLEGFIPIRLDSGLPARLEPNGQLRLQVRPGHWELSLFAYKTGQIAAVKAVPANKLWPEEEVWVFDARNHLRLVEPQGVTQVDPRQTSLPKNWHHLPAYRMAAGDVLSLVAQRRGDPDPEPDHIGMNRTLWLDFDGQGYSIQDVLTGTMTSEWRLEAGEEIQLGRVAIDGKPQFITRLKDGTTQGAEVRRGRLNLRADSRYEGAVAQIPIGWRHDLNQASATLHLPPGWDVFSISGIDNSPGSWLQRWTLLDLFMVLIAGLAVAKLFGLIWGIPALITLALIWHAPDAPHQVWLHLIASIALLRVAPSGGRLRPLVVWYRNLSVLTLVVLSVPFMIHQVRTGLYPQLDHYGYRVAMNPLVSGAGAMVKQSSPQMFNMASPMAEETDGADMMERERVAGLSKLKALSPVRGGVGRMNQALDFQAIDPTANVQTGPGLPAWQWRRLDLRWNGPVAQTQVVDLILISPVQKMLLNFLSVLLLLGLAIRLLVEPGTTGATELLRTFMPGQKRDGKPGAAS